MKYKVSRAAKDYMCCGCRNKILKGQKYTSITTYPGECSCLSDRPLTDKFCSNCKTTEVGGIEEATLYNCYTSTPFLVFIKRITEASDPVLQEALKKYDLTIDDINIKHSKHNGRHFITRPASAVFLKNTVSLETVRKVYASILH